jgi:DNA-binding NtrC family response regulator
MALIMVIEDDAQVRSILSKMLRRKGHEVMTAPEGRTALGLFRSREVDLVITDLIMPEKEGLETIQDIRHLAPDVPIIAISGGGKYVPTSYLETALHFGAQRAFEKPFDHQDLMEAVGELLPQTTARGTSVPPA